MFFGKKELAVRGNNEGMMVMSASQYGQLMQAAQRGIKSYQTGYTPDTFNFVFEVTDAENGYSQTSLGIATLGKHNGLECTLTAMGACKNDPRKTLFTLVCKGDRPDYERFEKSARPVVRQRMW